MSQTYESRHVREFLHINKNQLFHWIQTKKLMRPVVLGEGRGRRSQFSLDDLLTLSLIKTINDFGTELNIIRKIMVSIKNIEFPIFTVNELMKNPPEIQPYVKKREFKGSVWDYYRANRTELSSMGYSLEISRGAKLPAAKHALFRDEDGKMRRPATAEEIERIKARRIKMFGGLQLPAFRIRAFDGESQVLVLSSGINPSETRLDRTDFTMPGPSADMVIIISLLALIQYIEEETNRTV